MHRREFLKTSAVAATAASSPFIESAQAEAPIKGNAEHVISIWLGGGMAAMDTFDPKKVGDPSKNLPGSYYPSIDTSVSGVKLCEHLKLMAPLMDRVTAVRTVNHNVIDEHAAATNFMHTGRPVSGTVVYPSLGSIISHERGAVQDDAPSYVLIGYPNVTRGPGFLGAKHNFLYLTDTSRGPAGLSRPTSISPQRQSRRESILATLRQAQDSQQTQALKDYEEAIDMSQRLSGPSFNQSFQLDKEPTDLRNSYGGEFGQRCLLARRLVERGVRFIEVAHNLNFLNGTGWDTHNSGILQQHALIQELDSAVSTLILDLEKKKLLDKTLIVITTEFGRPPEFDAGGGRGHQGSAFTCVLAGGGLKHSGAYGLTDSYAKKILENPVSVPDFFATIHASLGIDYSKYLYDGDRPVPVTDRGQPIAALFQ